MWIKRYIAILFMVLVLAVPSWSATYYVDFDGGNDAANGTAEGTAWETLPGTTNGNTESIAAGDTIYLKPGTTYSSGDTGDAIRINSSYYAQPANAGEAITIQVYDAWTAASGAVTFDGTDIAPGAYYGLISIMSRNHIYFYGTVTNRIIIRDSAQLGLLVQGTDGAHSEGIKVSYVDIINSSSFGSSFNYTDDFVMEDCSASANTDDGFDCGAGNDQNSDGGEYIDCIAYDNSGSTAQGFGLYGCTNMVYTRCTAYGNEEDGFDFGSSKDTNNASAKVVDGTSYSNGEDGFVMNGGTAGERDVWWINCVSYNNGQAGFSAYAGGVDAYIYHCLAHNNVYNLIPYDESATLDVRVYIKNSIFYKPAGIFNIWEYDVDHAAGTKFYSDYNLWVQESDENFAQIEYYIEADGNYESIAYNGNARPGVWNAESRDYLPDTAQDDDNSGWNQDPAFIGVGSGDYRLTEGSWVIAQGVYINDPIETATDRSGKARPNPPAMGPYEFDTGEAEPGTGTITGGGAGFLTGE